MAAAKLIIPPCSWGISDREFRNRLVGGSGCVAVSSAPRGTELESVSEVNIPESGCGAHPAAPVSQSNSCWLTFPCPRRRRAQRRVDGGHTQRQAGESRGAHNSGLNAFSPPPLLWMVKASCCCPHLISLLAYAAAAAASPHPPSPCHLLNHMPGNVYLSSVRS